MNNSSKEISSLKKITAYKKIIKFKDIGLSDYEKRGNRKSSEKIIQVNALGDMIDDINGNLYII